jgi:KUP system potassium uptake protein
MDTLIPDATEQNSDKSTASKSSSPLALLCLTAIGVVYGDIGTSPLYALRECFYGTHAIPVSRENVLGVLSLILWTLIIVVALKYHVYIIRANNAGEGGILALMALVHSQQKNRKYFGLLIALGLFGAALLYGDGMITPAISVLSAVEGLEVATPYFKSFVVPITILILIALFLFQKRGTATLGIIFGPITCIWFVTLATLGIVSMVQRPDVLNAVNPIYAIRFFLANGVTGYLVLGAVFLVATGGEALYADLGHFGEKPLQIDWFMLVFPALLLNYFGQGALLLSNPETADNPFYRLAPSWALYPLVALAAMATVIASQAVISGVFSLTRQAVLLGYAPRMNVIHTSSREIGQIYIPGANWMLMVATIALVVTFKKSSNLAAAYGVAITTTMIITTALAYFVTRHVWHWSLPKALLITGFFLVIDMAFFGANIIKLMHGGWFPLFIGAIVFTLFTTWKRGRDLLARKLQQSVLPLETFVQEMSHPGIARVRGTAIFLNSDPKGTPIALLHNIKHNLVLHQTNIIVTVEVNEVPHVPENRRFQFDVVGAGVYRAILRYGFMEDPNVPAALTKLHEHGVDFHPERATYILSRNTLLPSRAPGMALWREKLFAFLSSNASRPTEFFRLPPNRVVELGMQIEI